MVGYDYDYVIVPHRRVGKKKNKNKKKKKEIIYKKILKKKKKMLVSYTFGWLYWLFDVAMCGHQNTQKFGPRSRPKGRKSNID